MTASKYPVVVLCIPEQEVSWMAERANKQSESKKRYDREYRREQMYSIAFRLSRNSDQELIEVYRSIPNKMEWFREALKSYGGLE